MLLNLSDIDSMVVNTTSHHFCSHCIVELATSDGKRRAYTQNAHHLPIYWGKDLRSHTNNRSIRIVLRIGVGFTIPSRQDTSLKPGSGAGLK